MIGLRIAQETDFFRNNPEGEIRTFWVLNRHIFPKLGAKSINAITPEMIRG